MNLQGIMIYSARAAAFAAAMCGIYAIICLLRRKRPHRKRMAAIAYLAALVQITVMRGGVDWQAVFRGGRDFPSLVPLQTTLYLLRESSTWNFIYNTMGNLLWFVPLGMLLNRRRAHHALLIGAAVSAGIELSQFLLRTGLTDIDDVIINALGALTGWALCRLMHSKNELTSDHA